MLPMFRWSSKIPFLQLDYKERLFALIVSFVTNKTSDDPLPMCCPVKFRYYEFYGSNNISQVDGI